MPNEPLTTLDLSLDQADAVIAAAKARAAELGCKMNIAVLDASGRLKALARMDGALLGCLDVAIAKARTAHGFNTPSGQIGELTQPGGPLFSLEHTNDGLATFAGGVPLRAPDGACLGAVGVSGSSVEHDRDVAEAGAAAL